MFDQSQKTYVALANALGVHRHTVQTIFATGKGDIGLIVEIVGLMGYSPTDLFDTSPGPMLQRLTGIKRVDAMLREVYNETYSTQGGGEAMAPHVASDYFCIYTGYISEVRDAYKKYFVPVPPCETKGYITLDGDRIELDMSSDVGLSYQAELMLNSRSAAATKSIFSKKLCDAQVLDIGLGVHYSIAERSSHDDKVVIRNMYDHVVLQRPIGEFVQNGRIKPKIRRRRWHQVRDWATIDSPHPDGIAFTEQSTMMLQEPQT